MAALFDERLPVHYGFVFLRQEDDEQPDLMDTRRGQANGLCGAAIPGVLSFVTGLHTGTVPFRIEWTEDEPPVGDEWEDVVEVPFSIEDRYLTLSSFQDAVAVQLPVAGAMRARYCARGMAAAAAADVAEDDSVIDSYLLQIWPSGSTSEAILRETPYATYWHETARELPPPPTAAERAAAQAAAAEDARVLEEQARIEAERRQWGGRSPSDRLRGLGGNVIGVARSDRDLLDEFAALDGNSQRRAANWLARRACERAGIDDLDWVRPALSALDRGEPLPAPFDDLTNAFRRLRPEDGSRVGVFVRVVRTPPEGSVPPAQRSIHRPSFALPAVVSAAPANPLQALVDTFSHAAATFHDERADLVAELRDRFLGA